MRLARYEIDGVARVGVLSGEDLFPVAEIVDGVPDDLVAVLSAGPELWSTLTRRVASVAKNGSPVGSVRLLAPIPRPGKFLAVGMNSEDHLAELDTEAESAELVKASRSALHLKEAYPEAMLPLIFNKQTSCIVGPVDDVWKPTDTDTLDYEGELTLVLGRRGRRIDLDKVDSLIAGFTVTNDVSVREWQNDAQTVWPGKSFETHGPTGPWVVTADELQPEGLAVRTWVNDLPRQDGSTDDWIYDHRSVVSIVSQVCTLEPGDLVAMGTPAGIGVATADYLDVGDRVKVAVEGVGEIENLIVPEPAPDTH